MPNQPARAVPGQVCPACAQVHDRCLGHTPGNRDRDGSRRYDPADPGWRPCRAAPLRGSDVCKRHGGQAGQVRRAGLRRVTEAEAREAARRGLIKAHGGPVADPLAELAELAGEVRALRAQLAGRMAEAPQEMAVLLPAWAGAAALMSKILVDLLGRMPVLDAPGRVAPVDIPAGFVADVIRRLGASLDEPPSPALPPDESEAAPEPPMLDDDQDEPLSASPLGPVRPSPVTDCHHQQVSRFPATGDIVVCAHCSGEWPLAEARRLGIWLAA